MATSAAIDADDADLGASTHVHLAMQMRLLVSAELLLLTSLFRMQPNHGSVLLHLPRAMPRPAAPLLRELARIDRIPKAVNNLMLPSQRDQERLARTVRRSDGTGHMAESSTFTFSDPDSYAAAFGDPRINLTNWCRRFQGEAVAAEF
jgi:hypothetical protein